MFTFLIADDEKVICSLIENLINWEEIGFHCIGSVNSGTEALQIIRKSKPDLVVTDIRMPGMDGIQLVRETIESGVKSKFIMVSGFRQFEYAHEAMQYGVQHYLLKPLDKDELEKAASKVFQELSRERNTEYAVYQMGSMRKKVKEHFLTSVLFGERNAGDIQSAGTLKDLGSVNSQYETSFSDGLYQAVFVKLDSVSPGTQDVTPILETIEDFSAVLRSQCSECIQTAMNTGLIILMNYPEALENEINADIEKLYQDISEYIKRFEGFRVTVGVGTGRDSIRDAWYCMKTAIDAVKFRVRYPEYTILFYDRFHFDDLTLEDILGNGMKNNVHRLMESGDSERLIREFNEQCDTLDKHGFSYSPILLYDLCTAYYDELKNHLSEVGFSSPSVSNQMEKWQLNIENGRSELTLRLETKKLLIGVIPEIQAELAQRAIRPVREAKEYISRHYAEDISLSSLADHVGLNASYLSSLFKKEYGISFSDYITECRINAAQELITSTRLSLNEVAEEVGFHDPKYFSKLFTKHVGLKPSVYRKLYT